MNLNLFFLLERLFSKQHVLIRFILRYWLLLFDQLRLVSRQGLGLAEFLNNSRVLSRVFTKKILLIFDLLESGLFLFSQFDDLLLRHTKEKTDVLILLLRNEIFLKFVNELSLLQERLFLFQLSLHFEVLFFICEHLFVLKSFDALAHHDLSLGLELLFRLVY